MCVSYYPQSSASQEELKVNFHAEVNIVQMFVDITACQGELNIIFISLLLLDLIVTFFL